MTKELILSTWIEKHARGSHDQSTHGDWAGKKGGGRKGGGPAPRAAKKKASKKAAKMSTNPIIAAAQAAVARGEPTRYVAQGRPGYQVRTMPTRRRGR